MDAKKRPCPRCGHEAMDVEPTIRKVRVGFVGEYDASPPEVERPGEHDRCSVCDYRSDVRSVRPPDPNAMLDDLLGN